MSKVDLSNQLFTLHLKVYAVFFFAINANIQIPLYISLKHSSSLNSMIGILNNCFLILERMFIFILYILYVVDYSLLLAFYLL